MSELDVRKTELAELLTHWPSAPFVGGTLYWPANGRTFWVEVSGQFREPPVIVFDGRRIVTDADKVKALCDLLEIPLA